DQKVPLPATTLRIYRAHRCQTARQQAASTTRSNGSDNQQQPPLTSAVPPPRRRRRRCRRCRRRHHHFHNQRGCQRRASQHNKGAREECESTSEQTRQCGRYLPRRHSIKMLSRECSGLLRGVGTRRVELRRGFEEGFEEDESRRALEEEAGERY
ncbi:hypothetical protein ALC56_08337, partial [Trachymyrmex septentrionalis]